MMSNVDVVLRSCDLLETAVVAPDLGTAMAAMRLELEVLSRDDLMLVASVLAWESTRVLTQSVDRARFRERVGRRRLNAMVGPVGDVS